MPATTTPEKPGTPVAQPGAEPVKADPKAANAPEAAPKPKNDVGFGTFQRAKRPEKEKEAPKSEVKDGKEAKAIAEVPEKKDEKEKEATTQAPEKNILKPQPKKQSVDLEQLVKSTVASTVRAVKAESKAEKTEKAELPKEEVPKRRQSEWDAIVKAEETGAAHKGSAVAAAEVFRIEDQYIRQWEKENPGRRFNANADEHNDWYEKNLPEWVEEASEAGADAAKSEKMEQRIREKLEKEAVAPLKQELETIRGREATQQAIQEAVPRIHSGLAAVAKAIDPDLLKLLESGKTAEEQDPLAHTILTAASHQLGSKLIEQAKIWATGGKAFANDNPVHKFIEKTHDDLVGTEDTDGLKLVPEWEYGQMSASNRSSHRPIDTAVMVEAITQIEVGLASAAYKSENERLERHAMARGWTKRNVAEETERNGHVENEEEAGHVDKPRSPSTAATTVIKPGAKTEVKVAQDSGSRLSGSLFQR